MSEANGTSADYRRGFADAGSKKWKYIRDMVGSAAFFLFIALWLVGPDLYDAYNEHQIKSEKVQACAHATDVTGCIAAIGK